MKIKTISLNLNDKIILQKIRCIDGVYREFVYDDSKKEVKCLECDLNFGVIDNNTILKKHLCNWKVNRKDLGVK